MLPPVLRLLQPFLRLFFHLLYHPLAWSYDAVAALVSLGMWQSWVVTVRPHLPGPQVLELGHGPGHLQLALRQDGIRTFGLDESRQMGRLAWRRLSGRGVDPCLARGLAQRLPYPSASFHQVVATFPSEYIFDRQTLAEIYRVLRPGGQAVMLLGAWITGRGPHHRAAAWLFRLTGQELTWHDQAFTVLRALGFEPRLEPVGLKSSKVLMVIAHKPINP